jgi:hypothetical protein
MLQNITGNDAGRSEVNEATQLTLGNLVQTVSKFPNSIKNNPAPRSYVLGLGIIKHFLGVEWLDKHVAPGIDDQGFMRLELSDQTKMHERAWRLTDLGELLFNLQYVEGFTVRIAEMKTQSPEAILAELHIARMVYINGWEFRFVDRVGERGKDYDLEINNVNGYTVCADAKCKEEETDLRDKTVENTLKSSRNQLPKDFPGTFFIKIPQQWMKTNGFEKIVIEAAQRFLKTTGRVVSVVFYIEPQVYKNGILAASHLYKEVLNPKHRFGPEKNWKMFNRYKPPSNLGSDAQNWDALPLSWIRLLYFSETGYHDPRQK